MTPDFSVPSCREEEHAHPSQIWSLKTARSPSVPSSRKEEHASKASISAPKALTPASVPAQREPVHARNLSLVPNPRTSLASALLLLPVISVLISCLLKGRQCMQKICVLSRIPKPVLLHPPQALSVLISCPLVKLQSACQEARHPPAEQTSPFQASPFQACPSWCMRQSPETLPLLLAETCLKAVIIGRVVIHLGLPMVVTGSPSLQAS